MIDDIIMKHALKNTQAHGKASPKAVVGKVIAEHPDCKKDMKGTMKKIATIVEKVNSMSPEQIEKEISNYTFTTKKKVEKGLKLEGAEHGKVITRFPPEPSGYPHIGHAKAAYLDMTAARKYDGKFILRFDDTNPEAESQEYVDAIKDALGWLAIDWDVEEYASDSLQKLYGYAERMIAEGNAYVCTCTPEQIRSNRSNTKECQCRSIAYDEGASHWKSMLDGTVKRGEAIVRFSGNMTSLNTAMRDPTLFRIINSPHYRQGNKYRVWPSYDFAAPILDSLSGVTHAMRTKEYELRDEVYNEILDSLGLRKPKIVEFSRLSIRGLPVSKRLLKPLIAKKLVSGWDDPRLPTITALKRRGIRPEAIKRFVLRFGLGKTESNPTIEALLVDNKKILDPVAERYFFVLSPVKLTVRSAPKIKAELKKHPDKELGKREMNTAGEFFISSKDADSLKQGEQFRLKDLYNVKLIQKAEELVGEFVGKEVGPGPKIQWVTTDYLEATVLVPDELVDSQGKVLEHSLRIDRGYCEPSCADIPEGHVIQFERYGFCRLDKKVGLQFIYTNP
ncbi:MAG: glutamate--tRNA ligase [Candidatus Micrarchaeota archaeon]